MNEMKTFQKIQKEKARFRRFCNWILGQQQNGNFLFSSESLKVANVGKKCESENTSVLETKKEKKVCSQKKKLNDFNFGDSYSFSTLLFPRFHVLTNSH